LVNEETTNSWENYTLMSSNKRNIEKEN